MKTKWLIGIAALLLATGCIVSITEHVEVPLEGNVSFTNGLVYEIVDLADYDVSKADIHSIERLQISGVVRNDLSSEDTMDVYISADTSFRTAAAVEAAYAAGNALAVLFNYVLPAGPGTIDTLSMKEGDALLQFDDANWTAVKTLVLTGDFTAYLTSTGGTANGEIIEAKLHLTLTGKPE